MTEKRISACQNEQNINVLLISRTTSFVRSVLEILARKAIRGIVFDNSGSAFDFLEKNICRLVFIDENISRHSQIPPAAEEAFCFLSRIRSDFPELPVVMVASDDDKQSPVPGRCKTHLIESSVRAIQAGCRDFLIHPVANKQLEKLLETIVPNRPVHSAGTVQTIASTENGSSCLYQIVGQSPNLIQTVNLARKIASTSASVLISGESGTGKELISYVVHYNSRRAQGPFVKVNCAALSESLLESELFGHEKGAFTGAYTQRKGRFEMAHGGTLLLDEISETPLRFQAKLLRVLEQQDFQRVGGNDSIKADVRIISTTNKDLLAETACGQFRQDLYYRLCGVRLIVSPLRQRKEDLPELIWYFVNLYAGQANRRITSLDRTMLEIFSNYHWPGNIRQLRNVVFTSLVLGVGETLSLADVSWLFDELQPKPEIVEQKSHVEPPVTPVPGTGVSTSSSSAPLAGISLDQLEQRAIIDTLKQTNGNQLMAAKTLGISDRTLRDKIKRYRQQGSLQPV